MGKKLLYLNSQFNSAQKGGLSLRNMGLKKIYNNQGFDIEEIFQQDIPLRSGLSRLKSYFLYGKRPLVLFKKSNLQLPNADIIHFDNLRHFNYFPLPKRPIIYNAHNLEFESFYERKSSIHQKNFIKYEIKTMNKADLIFVCSDREKNLICSLDSKLQKKVKVVPNLVDKDQYYSDEKKYISFIGTLDYFPNIEALKFIISELLPIISRSDFKLIIAGRNPTQEVKELCTHHNVELKANLTSIEISRLYAQSYLLLAPLSFGSGTRLKIIEALFSKAIVLSTPLGAEGLYSNSIITTELNNFAKNLSTILKNNTQFDESELDTIYSRYDSSTWSDINYNMINNYFEALK